MPSLQKKNLTVDIVIPTYNEFGVVDKTHAHLGDILDSLPYQFSIYYVDDGSTDGTAEVLSAIADQDKRVTVLTLSRNFGHQAALCAGLDRSQGQLVISMDCDGQHPPEMIPQMIDLALSGYDIVQTQRLDDNERPSLKKWTSDTFYKLINLISGTHILRGAADFRLMTRQVVDALQGMPEFHRFLRGMVFWVGYSVVILPYQVGKRVGGRSKYSLGKMIRLAMDAIFSFSLAPLYIGFSMGGLMLLMALGEMIYVYSFWATGQESLLEPGWSSLMFAVLIVGGILMIMLGFIGIYVGYIFQEVKHRPLYLVKSEKKAGDE